MREYLGKAVIAGEIQYLSVSSLERADTRNSGCARKWWYRYVAGIKEEQTTSQAEGIALHDAIAKYIETGDKALPDLVLKGMHLIPDPGPGVYTNVYVSPKDKLVTAAGIPLVMEMDCMSTRGVNKGGEDVTDIYDPPGTVEIIDWKWKRDGSKSEYYLQPGEMLRSIQMSGYGVAASKLVQGTKYVRLSHGYFPATKGLPRKVTKLHVVDDCHRSWEYTDGLAHTLKDVAKETSPERVDYNVHACDRYGGCAYRKAPYNCSGYGANSLTKIFGETEAREITMGLTNVTNNVPPWVPQTASAPLDMRAQLAAEEVALKSQQQKIQGKGDSFFEACSYISTRGHGFPRLTGEAAAAAWKAGGQNVVPGTDYPGSGDLGNVICFDKPDQVIQLANELYAKDQAKVVHNTMPAAILPPDAPVSNPALAAKPVEGFSTPVPMFGTPTVTPTPVFVDPTAPVIALPEPAPKKRGRPKVVEAATAVVQQPAAEPPPVSTAAPVAPTAVAAETLEIFVDCIPNGAYESLHPYLDKLCDVLCTRYIAPGQLRDIRCAPKDSPLGFGGWRGAVGAMARELPPPTGRYYLDTRGSEIAAEVADSLRLLCEQKGALYVRGIR